MRDTFSCGKVFRTLKVIDEAGPLGIDRFHRRVGTFGAAYAGTRLGSGGSAGYPVQLPLDAAVSDRGHLVLAVLFSPFSRVPVALHSCSNFSTRCAHRSAAGCWFIWQWAQCSPRSPAARVVRR